jgi:esterase/lipase superfamily enzyme
VPLTTSLRPLAAALALAGLAALAACGQRGFIPLYPEGEGVGTRHDILVVTNRSAVEENLVFGRDRSEELAYARFAISVPPEHRPGTVTFPDSLPPDPRTEFVTLEARRLASSAAFVAAVDAEMARRPRGAREASIFTHGYNTNFAEGLFRQAQMRHDFSAPGISIHYAWPSTGTLRGYAADRESAIFARDGLEELIRTLAATRTERIILGAHSMGALVAMEALRQLVLAGERGALDKLQAVVLMNPDLDIDVFRRQMQVLARADVPVYIFVSSADRALRASSILRGQDARLGSMADFTAVADLPVTVIDVTNVRDSTEALDHMAVAASPTMIGLIAGMRGLGEEMFADEQRGPGLLEGTANVIQGTAALVLEPLIPQ